MPARSPLLALCVLLAAGAAPARADAPKVVADIAPVHSLVAQVMAGVGEPVLLLDGSGDPHGGSLRPSQMRALRGADLFVWIGPELSGWIDPPADASLPLLAQPATILLPLRGEHGHHDGHEDHGKHDDHDGHGEHGGKEDHHDDEEHAHDHGDSAVDPHAWLDPANARAWLSLVAEKLAEADPGNAMRYRANAVTAAERLAMVEEEIAATLAPARATPFAVEHDAFHYFEDRFGLESATALSSAYGERPGAARVQRVAEELAESGARCVFAEAGGSSRLLDRVTAGTEARIVPLDVLGNTLRPGPDLYAAMLTGMADAMADCLTAP